MRWFACYQPITKEPVLYFASSINEAKYMCFKHARQAGYKLAWLSIRGSLWRGKEPEAITINGITFGAL